MQTHLRGDADGSELEAGLELANFISAVSARYSGRVVNGTFTA